MPHSNCFGENCATRNSITAKSVSGSKPNVKQSKAVVGTIPVDAYTNIDPASTPNKSYMKKVG